MIPEKRKLENNLGATGIGRIIRMRSAEGLLVRIHFIILLNGSFDIITLLYQFMIG